jgi:uncharacterized protein
MVLAPAVLIVPGLHNSGPEHWQTLWERKHGAYVRVNQRDWDNPRCSEWVETFDRAMMAAGSSVVVAAHSLGCATVAHWAKSHKRKIFGALLAAPTDVDAPTIPEGSSGFAPMPLGRLPFRTIVAASSNDPYVTLERAKYFAESWGAEFVDIGEAGHINAESGHGEWPKGEELLAQILREAMHQ